MSITKLTGLAQRDDEKTVQLVAINQLIDTANTGTANFVLKPGATAQGNVYSDMTAAGITALCTAMAAVPGIKTLYIDDSLATCTMPLGSFNFKHVSIGGVAPRSTGNAIRSILTIPEGCQMPGLRRISGQVSVRVTATTTPVVPASDFGASGNGNVIFVGFGTDCDFPEILCTGGAPLWEINAAAGPVFAALRVCVINLPASGSVFPVWSLVDSGATLTTQSLEFANLGGKLVGGVVGSIWNDSTFGATGLIGVDQSPFLGTRNFSQVARTKNRITPQSVGGAAPVPSTAALSLSGNNGFQWADTGLFDTTAGNISQSLPNVATGYVQTGAARSTIGLQMSVANVAGSNYVLVSPAATQTINGSTSAFRVSPGTRVTFEADGVSNWIVVASAGRPSTAYAVAGAGTNRSFNASTVTLGDLANVVSTLISDLQQRNLLGSMAGVTKDATSNIYCPANAAEWATVLGAASITTGNPSALWLMQEASGNLADSIDSKTLAASGLTYQRTISGWARKGVGSNADDGAGSASLTGAAIGDINTVSGLLLAYVKVTSTPGALRDVMGLGGSTTYRGAQVDTTPAYNAVPNDGSDSETGLSNISTSVRPVIVHVDRTAGTWRVITDQEIITPSPYTAPPASGSGVFFGAALTTAPNFSVLYSACFRSTAAELTDAQIRTLLQTLGWAVAW